MKLNSHGDGYFLIDEEDQKENYNRRNSVDEIIINQSNIFFNIKPKLQIIFKMKL